MTAQLIPLFVAVPVLASALAAIAPWLPLRRLLALAVPAASTAGGIALVLAHRTVPVLAEQVGGFVPGVAIPLVSDSFSALMLVATGLVATVALWFSDATGEYRGRFFPALALLLLAGVNGALLTGDLFNLFVFVEVMLMPSYALIAMTGGWRRLGIGRLFVVVNLLTSTVLLAGVGLVYAVAGTVNLAALAGAARDDGRLAAALGIVLVALLVKAGCVPVHGWLPRSYPATSPGVMALFSGLHTKVALYAVIRIWAVGLGLDPAWTWVLLTVALVTTTWGALASYSPLGAREVLSWQMVSGVGVILAALAVGSHGWGSAAATAGLTGAIVYMVHHMITIGALVTGLGAAEHTYGTGRLDRLSGLWHRDRPVAVVVAAGIAALVGLPLTSGLVGKLEVVRAALVPGGVAGWLVVAAVLASSIVGLAAMLRMWKLGFWGAPMPRYRPECDVRGRAEWTDLPADVHVPARLVAPAAALALVSAALFLGYGMVAPVVDRAVHGLVQPGYYQRAVLGDHWTGAPEGGGH